MLDEKEIIGCRKNLLAANDRVRELQAELKEAKIEAESAYLSLIRCCCDNEPLLKGVGMMESSG